VYNMPTAEEIAAAAAVKQSFEDNIEKVTKHPFLEECEKAGFTFDVDGKIASGSTVSEGMKNTYPNFLKQLSLLYFNTTTNKSRLNPLFMKLNVFINPYVFEKKHVDDFIALNAAVDIYTTALTAFHALRTKGNLHTVAMAHLNLKHILTINNGLLTGVVRTPPTDLELQEYTSITTDAVLNAEYGVDAA
jgi:hypothetical protein